MLPLGLVLIQTARSPILLDVDATQAPRGVLRVKETLPEAKGNVRLSLPKWIPGEHRASGTLDSVVRLHLFAGSRELAWSRDPYDAFTVRVAAPSGGGSLRAEFVVASSQGENLAPKLGRIKWTRLILLPDGDASRLAVRASLQAPEGWAVQTALLPTPTAGRAEFSPVSAERLLDSPAQIGANARTFSLAPGYWLDVLADGPAGLELKPETLASFKALVTQSQRLFGSRHFGQYRFLVTLSDHGAIDGLEHHESTEIGLSAQGTLFNLGIGDVAAHEMFHSWNGKYRRPKGLVRRDFRFPYDTGLLWVYEGLTQCYQHSLAARAGFDTPQAARESLAADLASEIAQSGRSWRSVADTAVAMGSLVSATPPGWGLDRRGEDYYDEGGFVWLEVDATIRRLTGGRRSLDDFCRRFAAGDDRGPEVKPYSLGDVIRELKEIAPYDWAGLFRSRLYDVHPAPPTEGFEATGWRLVYNATPNVFCRFATLPAGMEMTADGAVRSVALDSPAYRTGLNAGDRITAINGQAFSPAVFNAEIEKKGPLRLVFVSQGATLTGDLDYHGGLAYPHLERIEGKPDLLSEILRPLK